MQVAGRVPAPSSTDGDAAVAAAHLSDDDRLLTMLAQTLHGFVRVLGGNTDRHADTAIERAIHLRIRDVAGLLQPIEYRRPLPSLSAQDRLEPVGQNARNVLDEPAASDVRDAVDRDGLGQREHGLHVDAGGSEQRIVEQPRPELRLRRGLGNLQELTNERITMRVRSRRWQTDDRIAGAGAAAVDDRILLDDPDAKARKVVIAFGVHTWHFRG